MLNHEAVTVEELAQGVTPASQLGSPWDGPSLLADRVDQAVALAIDLPVARRHALRAAMRFALDADVTARRELGRTDEDAVVDALRAAGPPRVFAQRFLFPGERLRLEDTPVEAMGWAARWFGGWIALLVGLQFASHAVGMSWHLLAGDYDRTPEWLSALIWTGLPAALGARCGWRTRRSGWLVLIAVLATAGFVLPGILNYLTGHPGVGDGERSLVHELAFWLTPLCRAWIPIALIAAGGAELVRVGLRTYRERVRWRTAP